MFRGPVPQASQAGIPAWAPHPSWGPQAASAYAAAANYNPYKRQPNPGGRDYWNTKLSDNPLGLENMHIRCVSPSSVASEVGIMLLQGDGAQEDERERRDAHALGLGPEGTL